jgi:hypothetical protein
MLPSRRREMQLGLDHCGRAALEGGSHLCHHWKDVMVSPRAELEGRRLGEGRYDRDSDPFRDLNLSQNEILKGEDLYEKPWLEIIYSQEEDV